MVLGFRVLRGVGRVRVGGRIREIRRMNKITQNPKP